MNAVVPPVAPGSPLPLSTAAGSLADILPPPQVLIIIDEDEDKD
jgi:hypothetical protein